MMIWRTSRQCWPGTLCDRAVTDRRRLASSRPGIRHPYRVEVLSLIAEARTQAADRLGVAPSEVGWVRNVSEGVPAVLGSIDLASGDELVTSRHGYGAVHCAGALGPATRRDRARGGLSGGGHGRMEVVEADRAQLGEVVQRVRDGGGCVTSTSAMSRRSTTPSPLSTRPSGSMGRRSSACADKNAAHPGASTTGAGARSTSMAGPSLLVRRHREPMLIDRTMTRFVVPIYSERRTTREGTRNERHQAVHRRSGDPRAAQH